MLPLSAEKTSATADELADALRRGLLAHGITPRSVEATGGVFPKVEALRIDLTGAQLTREARPPATTGDIANAVEIERFEVTGAPVFFEKAALDLSLEAEQVQAHTTNDALVVDNAAAGTVTIAIAKESLEALVQSIAAEAAGKQGVEVRKTTLTFVQDGPRAVSFRAEITAKVFVMSPTLALSGRLEIDGELNARFANLTLGGDAMITTLAGGFIRPYLDKLEGRVFPLLAFSLGDLKLEHVELLAGPPLQAHARFGSSV